MVLVIIFTTSTSFYGQKVDPSTIPLDSLSILLNNSENDDRYQYLWHLTFRYSSINIDSAFQYGKKHLELAERESNIKEIANAKLRLAIVYCIKSQNDEGLDLLMQASQTYLELGDSVSASKGYINMGVVNINVGKYDEALKNSLKALEIQEQLTPLDTLTIASLRGNLSFLFQKSEKYDLALDQLDEMEDLVANTSDELMVKCLINKYNIKSALGQHEESLQELLRALSISKSTENKATLSGVYHLIGSAYLNLKDNKNSLENSLIAYNMVKLVRDKRNLVNISNNIATAYIEMGNMVKARPYLEEVKDLTLKNGQSNSLMIAYSQLAKIDSTLGDFKGAYFNKQNQLILYDSVFQLEKIKEIERITSTFEVEKKDEEIQLLRQQEEIRSLQLSKQRGWIIIGSVVIGSLVLLSYLFFQLYRLKQRNNEALTQRNELIESQKTTIQQSLEEKELLLREVYHRTKNNLSLVSSLLGIAVDYGVGNNAKVALIDSRNRVRSIALIHQMLFEHKSQVGLSTEVPNYIQAIVDSIKDSFDDSNDIHITHNIEHVALDADLLIPLGLIINEAVTNAMKHAFLSDQDSKLVHIFLGTEEESVILRIVDNGQGLSKVKYSNEYNGFGLDLIRGLADQIESKLEINFEQGGFVQLSLSALDEQVVVVSSN